MTEAQKDTGRAQAAASAIVDGRNPIYKMGEISVTLEHVIATVLLAVHGRDPSVAAKMLNEALVPGVEARLALYNSNSN